MIDYLKGKLDSLTPATAVVECHGVGYMLNISLNTFSAIQGKPEVKLYVYEAIREDAWVLFGFSTIHERQLFLQLISVSGVGGNTARTILSAFTPAELCDVIINGNEKVLKTVKGLGTKTSQRIIHQPAGLRRCHRGAQGAGLSSCSCGESGQGCAQGRPVGFCGIGDQTGFQNALIYDQKIKNTSFSLPQMKKNVILP